MAEQTKEERVYAVFERIAGGYDRANRAISLGLHRRWKAVLVQKLAKTVPPGGRALDVCCGTGDIVLDLARRRPDIQATGLDFSPAMLRQAEVRRGSLRNAELLRGDALALPFPDGSFDAASVSFGLRNTADWEKAAAELVRVVRPGGLVCCMDSFVPENPLVQPFYRLYFGHVMPLLGGGRYAQREYRWLYTSTEGFLRPGALKKLFVRAGLGAVGTQAWLFGACALIWGRALPFTENQKNEYTSRTILKDKEEYAHE